MGGIGCELQGECGWGIGGFQIVIQGDRGFVSVCVGATTSSLEEKKYKLLGANKWRKTLTGREMCEVLLKEEICI